MKLDVMVKKLKKGDPLALAKSISIVENKRDNYRELMEKIYPIESKAIKIGITGAPGSGKSLITDKIINLLKEKNQKIGIVAVDPSSPISGGAMLGDRIRMNEHSNDKNVFIRSMASRGYLGGLTGSIHEILDLYEASKMDVIIVETVGVGQSEIDIVNIVDVVVMVMTPAAGDEIQILKAGIVEIADIFTVNKSDLGGADKKVLEIKNYFSLSDKNPEVLKLSAINNEGIKDLLNSIYSFYETNKKHIAEKKKKIRNNFILKIVQDKVKENIEKIPSLKKILNGKNDESPFETAGKIINKILKERDCDKKN